MWQQNAQNTIHIPKRQKVYLNESILYLIKVFAWMAPVN